MISFKEKAIILDKELNISSVDIQKVHDNTQIWFITLSNNELKDFAVSIITLGIEVQAGKYNPSRGLIYILQTLQIMLLKELDNRIGEM